MTPSTDAPVVDGDLLQALAAGERQAVARLYERYGSKMIAFARRYVGDDAEDVVDDLIQRWLEQPPRPRDPDRVASFVAVSVYHAAVDWIHRQRAGQGRAPRASTDPVISDGREAIPLAAATTHSTPATLKARLDGALEHLSGSDRLLLESHYGHALTAEETMALLGISRPAFHQRLHRARARLLRLLETT